MIIFNLRFCNNVLYLVLSAEHFNTLFRIKVNYVNFKSYADYGNGFIFFPSKLRSKSGYIVVPGPLVMCHDCKQNITWTSMYGTLILQENFITRTT